MLITIKKVVLTCLLTLIITINAAAQTDQAPNYIILIGDDMAVDTLSCYQVGENAAETPTLDQLCQSGVRFDNFWTQSVCSPTRATLLTGQYGFANGVGGPATGIQNIDWKIPPVPTSANPTENIAMGVGMAGAGMAGGAMGAMAGRGTWVNPSIPGDAKTFVQALRRNDYQTAAVGKWHLANDTNGGLDHPKIAGFDHYAGGLRGGNIADFTAWSKSIDGSQPFGKTGYATTDIIDDSIAWLNKVDSAKPWLLWVAFNAPHSPWHKPPVELLNSDIAKNLASSGETDRAYYRAMIEAMDTEIGRLLAELDPVTRDNTYIIFMGDNGTPDETVTEPFVAYKAKGSLYQAGINSPLFIAGPGISKQQTSPALANSVDLYKTILDISNLDAEQERDYARHSVSLTPILFDDVTTQVREFAYADSFGIVGGIERDAQAIRNDQYKLIKFETEGKEELYDLINDPYENVNLLSRPLSETEQTHYTQLSEIISNLVNDK